MRLFCSLLMLLIFAGCGQKKLDLDSEVTDPVQEPAVVIGYNSPPASQYQNGVGFRATSDGGDLYLSIANQSSTPLILGPEAFRIIYNGRQYAFTPQKHNLSSFKVTTIPANSIFTFFVQVVDIPDLTAQSIVLNYPLKEVLLRVPIEKVTQEYDLILEQNLNAK